MSDRNNLFGVIRYWAAYSVLMLHYVCFWRTYRGYLYEVEEVFDRVTAFTPVVIFIAVSGYLTAASLDRAPDLKSFLIRRLKRIYIPLWVSMIVYLIAYLYIAADYIDHTIIRWFVLGMAGIAYTPSCLKEFASGSANGVLWTVTVLIELYIVTGFLWKRIRNTIEGVKGILLVPVLGLFNLISEYAVEHLQTDIVSKILERSFIPYVVFFYIGILGYIYKDRLKGIMQFIGIAAVIGVFVLIRFKIPDYGYYTGIIRGTLTAVAAVGIGSWSPSSIGDSGAAGLWGLFGRVDFTYEIYLYQWLVFNVIICYGLYDTLEWDVLKKIVIITVVSIAIIMRTVVYAGSALCEYGIRHNRSRGMTA